MAGTVIIAISTFAGVDLRGEILKVNPNLPNHWDNMKFSLTFKGTNYDFEISQKEISIVTDNDTELTVFSTKHILRKNQESIFVK